MNILCKLGFHRWARVWKWIESKKISWDGDIERLLKTRGVLHTPDGYFFDCSRFKCSRCKKQVLAPHHAPEGYMPRMGS